MAVLVSRSVWSCFLCETASKYLDRQILGRLIGGRELKTVDLCGNHAVYMVFSGGVVSFAQKFIPFLDYLCLKYHERNEL